MMPAVDEWPKLGRITALGTSGTTLTATANGDQTATPVWALDDMTGAGIGDEVLITRAERRRFIRRVR
jgi:hypothetical protein